MSDAHHNSYAAASEICSWLHQNNISHYKINIPYNPSKKFFQELNVKLSSIKEEIEYKKKLIGYRIGLIGGASSWLIASNFERENVEKDRQIDRKIGV